MASIQFRSSVLAIKKEVTEGTPVLPAAATDFISQQDDFTIDPAFDTLENAQLTGSIGVSKAIIGSENPTLSFSHYLRNSGVVGQAPNYAPLLEASLGAVSIASTEYPTVASSTTSVIKVNTGIGANFERGQALLIKDPVNGTRVRAIESVSGDNLTLGFQVPSAPAAAVNLGKAVLYKPANTGHPSITMTNYVGNGGAIQMIAGARVTQVDFDMTAGSLINGSYSLAGIGYYFDPIEILAADRYLDFTTDSGTFAAVIAAKMYKDPHELADALASAMNSAAPVETSTVTYDNLTGKFTIKSTGTVLSLLWNTGTNAANTVGDKIGFSLAANSTGSAATTGYTSATSLVLSAPYTPTFDAADPLVAKDNEIMIGDVTDYACAAASSVKFSIATAKSDIASICSATGKAGSIVSSREVTGTVNALLSQYDADKWRRFKSNSNTKLQYTFGEKSGGNWVAGKTGCIFIPTATITKFNVENTDGLATMTFDFKGYVLNGLGEVFINFV